MPKYQGCAALLLLLFGFWTPLPAQPSPPPMACTAQAASTPLLRAEGVAELVGDVIIKCEGGTPTAVGLPLPQVNVQIFMSPSINVTSRRAAGLFSEALLFIDDPAPEDQLLCPPATALPECNATAGPYRGNIFQARQAGANSLLWQAVPIDPPGSIGTRIVRMTNVRVNASQVGQGASRASTNISIVPVITPAPGNPVIFPAAPIRVGVIQPSTTFSVLPRSLPHCESRNVGLPGQPASSSSVAVLRYTELFATAFKRRNVAVSGPSFEVPPEPIAQDVLGAIYNTESGYMKAPVPGAQTPTAGLADHGTRLMARFNNIPNGVQLWTETAPRFPNGPSTAPARLVGTDANGAGPFNAIASTAQLNDQGRVAPIVRIPIVNGQGTAVWEIVNSDPTKIESLDIATIVAYAANGTFAGSPPQGTINVEMSMGPFSPSGTVLDSDISANPIPRFVQAPQPLPVAANSFPLITLHSCAPGAVPQINLTGGFQGGSTLTVNYPLDSSLVRPFNIPVVSENGPATVRVAPFAETLAHLSAENPAVTSNWLEATVTQGTTPATITGQVHPVGLAPGEYSGRIDISSPQASNTQRVNVTLRVFPEGPSFLPGTVNHGASYAAGFLSPGAVTTIFGLRFGPPQLSSLTLGPDGKVTTISGQTRVLIDGVPAPMIYARGGPLSQLSFFAPYSLTGKTAATVQVEYAGGRSLVVTLPVINVAPGLFTLNSQGFGQGAVLNQNLSVNGPNNPARPGDIIVLYGSGYGQSNPAGTDGKQAAAPLPVPLQLMSVLIGGKQGIIKYQGAAPGLTEGIFQINVEIPADVTPGDQVEVQVRQGSRISPPGVTVAIQ